MDKFERFDKFEKLDRKVEETIREVETMDRRKFYRNSFVCAGVWALLLNLVIETLGRFPTVGIFGGLSFMVHSPLVFLYNALILYATLVLASLFKRRVFFFTIVSIFWLGIGIIIDGKIYTGKSGFSGEFGHVNAFDNEILCHCGKKGCLETEASGSALHRTLLERIARGESSILSERAAEAENPITMDEIIEAVEKEDLLCIEIVEEIGQKLGRQIAGLISIFNPELVIIGGTLSLTGDYIIQPIRTAVRKYSLNLVNRDAVIIQSGLKAKAGVVGACMLARSRVFES